MKNLNIVIPMAGEGSRFAERGFSFPKPLIQMPNGDPMIKTVIDCVKIRGANWHFIVRSEHEEKYSLSTILPRMTKKWNPSSVNVHELSEVTEGAACTVLKLEDKINNGDPLLIVNSDQYWIWNPQFFFEDMEKEFAAGGILTFKSNHPCWSFVNIDIDGWIQEVAEKIPISQDATVGVYYFKHGDLFVTAANSMITKNKRVNNEFYIAPVYNELIEGGYKIAPYRVDFMSGLGDPESHQRFCLMYWMDKIPHGF